MVWALLAILGVPIWLVVGGLTATLLNRRRFKRQPGVFRMKFRAEDDEKWPRPASYGRWVHDVLLINKGLGLVPTTAVGIKQFHDISEDEAVKGFDKAVIFRFTLDDDKSGYVAVADESVSLAYGPFHTEQNT
jgi:hypothetical protein